MEALAHGRYAARFGEDKILTLQAFGLGKTSQLASCLMSASSSSVDMARDLFHSWVFFYRLPILP